ncbi:putative bifunctional diguanylate cyclase/phosphodiesterase [Sphingomonas sp. ac-8]|uniref:putative bifunctional diguanylate cyclase/phosphodiesterase n=1 Tax=Sphingomonas sp. ac-8 TaxID=3242977 RepID=UPI003A811885
MLVAFGTLLLVAFVLLATGLGVANRIRDENAEVARMSALLRTQGHEDHLQQQLRLAIGEVTRLAETGVPVPPARWAQVSRGVSAFGQRAGMAETADLVPELRDSVAARAEAAARFSARGNDLLATARRDPAAIKPQMGAFLAALRDLEAAQSTTRMVLTRTIDEAITGNARTMYRNILRVLIAGGLTVVALAGALVWLRRQVISPIVVIADRLRAFNRNEATAIELPGLQREDELGELARCLFVYRQAVEQRRSAERHADHLAHHDALTGLPNRLQFENRLAEALSEARRTDARVAVFAIDLDEFKAINDRHGHAGGDRALRRAAQLLAGCVGSDDLVARIGGDEFAILQIAPDQPAAAEALAARILRGCAETAQGTIPIRLSIGVAVSGPEQNLEELHVLADLAMYRAKSEGRGVARFFDNRLQEEVRLRRRLARDLGRAVERGELHLVYQPLADARTLGVLGHEALLRWTHPELGQISPERFVPLAEADGLIDSIGLWLADKAMARAARGPRHQFLALNLSPIQLRRRELAGELLALAAAHGIDPARLEFEVTESATLLGSRRDTVLAVLHQLQQAGARIVMDDFGTGHASLGNLRDFRFDKLKIDRSFVIAMDHHPPSESIVRTTLALGASLGIPVVAEGVETGAQLAMLRLWGCEQVQGYWIGRPQPEPAPAFADRA